MKRLDLVRLMKFAEYLVLDAGKILLKHRKSVKIVRQKDQEDIATSADLASEKFIVGEIRRKFTDHAIYSEESGEIDIKSDYRWVIDPLDGTKEFVRDIPLFNISIALEYKGELLVSALYRPSENVLYSAAKRIGSFKNGAKITVSKKVELSESFVYCYLPSFKRNQEKYDWAFEKLAKIGKIAYRLRALADENTALCWLAQGGIEAYINLSNPPKKHDIATGLLIAKESGAIVDTEKIPVLVCNNEKIYNQILRLL